LIFVGSPIHPPLGALTRSQVAISVVGLFLANRNLSRRH
jgi:hypothetical protein